MLAAIITMTSFLVFCGVLIVCESSIGRTIVGFNAGPKSRKNRKIEPFNLSDFKISEITKQAVEIRNSALVRASKYELDVSLAIKCPPINDVNHPLTENYILALRELTELERSIPVDPSIEVAKSFRNRAIEFSQKVLKAEIQTIMHLLNSEGLSRTEGSDLNKSLIEVYALLNRNENDYDNVVSSSVAAKKAETDALTTIETKSLIDSFSSLFNRIFRRKSKEPITRRFSSFYLYDNFYENEAARKCIFNTHNEAIERSRQITAATPTMEDMFDSAKTFAAAESSKIAKIDEAVSITNRIIEELEEKSRQLELQLQGRQFNPRANNFQL